LDGDPPILCLDDSQSGVDRFQKVDHCVHVKLVVLSDKDTRDAAWLINEGGGSIVRLERTEIIVIFFLWMAYGA
jgi:hypothetical protein